MVDIQFCLIHLQVNHKKAVHHSKLNRSTEQMFSYQFGRLTLNRLVGSVQSLAGKSPQTTRALNMMMISQRLSKPEPNTLLKMLSTRIWCGIWM